MWNEVNTDEDVEDFKRETEIIDDSTEITSLKYENHNLLLVLESRTLGRLEMFFEGVRHFSNCRLGRSYWRYCGGCYLEFRTDLLGKTRNDRLIMWTDSSKVFQKEKPFDFEADNAIVIADRMKYRFIDDIDDTTEKSFKAEQSLREIVEENHLIEITWDYFWNNFDSYIIECPEEADSLNIKDRSSVKAYFHYYSYKHHPESSEGVIYAYDYIETSITFCYPDDTYLGYYNLMFDFNLNILDDFFVIE